MDSAPWTATKANAMTPAEMAAFLSQPLPARLATYRTDGFVHLTPVWFAFEDGCFYFTLGERRRHLKNLRLDPRATLLVDIDQRSAEEPNGPVRAVMCCGTVALDTDPARVAAMEEAIDRRYLGTGEPGDDLPASPESYVLLRLVPSTMMTWDFSKQ